MPLPLASVIEGEVIWLVPLELPFSIVPLPEAIKATLVTPVTVVGVAPLPSWILPPAALVMVKV